MLDRVLLYYVTLFCVTYTSYQGLPEPAKLVIEFLAGPYAVPTALALSLLTYWFRGMTAAERGANQRAVLRGLMTAFFAWGLAALIDLEMQAELGGAQDVSTLCWHGPPSACPAAAMGFALAAVLWRQNWRRGLGVCLMTGVWVIAQAYSGVRYPMDVFVGTILGISMAWGLQIITLLDRLFDAFVRLVRRLMLA